MGRDRRLPARRRQLFSALLAVTAVVVGPVAAAMAHPLGNFTINHYAGVRIEPDRVLLDVVIDEAEIPAFQSRQAIDLDDNDDASDAELRAGAETRCGELASGLALTVDGGSPIPLLLQEAGLSFPVGTTGLSTLRLVCAFQAGLSTPIGADVPTRITFEDTTRPDRLGWREIVTVGSGVAVSAIDGEVRVSSPSGRLTNYPKDLIARPLSDTAITFSAVADPTVTAPPFDVPDASPIGAEVPTDPDPSTNVPPVSGAVPGGVGGELPTIFREANLTPIVLLLSLITAAALGAGHALTPGHGKTLMAAYLVGTRGTSLHALGLGLAVSVSHTAGILVLAAIVLGAADVLPPETVVRTAPLIAALTILGIGGWMLIGELRRRRSITASMKARAAAEQEHAAAHEHDHPHEHDAHEDEHEHQDHDAGEHSHGGVRHSHLPAAGSTITWRSLFVLGLAGGLIPSTSALLILLGSIAAGRPAFGFILVVAFGLGMAGVMTGIGLVMVFARGRLDRLPGGGGLGRFRDAVPLVAAVLVFGFGLYLTVQALGGATTL